MTEAESKSAPIVEVREHNGAPALFIDGTPNTGLMFFHARFADAAMETAGFASAGIHLFSPGCRVGLVEDARHYDFSQIDLLIDSILRADPDAFIMPRIDLDPPKWWLQRRPDEVMQCRDPVTGETRSGHVVALASELWRLEFGRALREFIPHCEERNGDRIIGYHPAGGSANEWGYSWDQVLCDFSAPQTKAFQRWLRRQYGDDVSKLRAAWNDVTVTFDHVKVPADRVRAGWQLSLLDPKSGRRVIDYLTFHSEQAADSALHFCGVIKKALAELGRRKVVAVFYGYHFWDVCRPTWFHNSGHHALAKILDSPDVDLVCAPYSYQERHPGGTLVPQTVPGSIRIHGKLHYGEEDTRSYLAADNDASWSPKCPNEHTLTGAWRRSVMGCLTWGGSQWWMDMTGNGWFRDAAMFQEIAKLRKLGEKYLAQGRHPRAQVAVIVSKETAPYFRCDETLTDALLGRQMSELAHSGMPFDIYLASDLPRIFSESWSDTYRLVIMADAFCVPPAQRRAIRDKIARNDRTILWIYASGLIADDGFSITDSAELTGIRIGMGADRDLLHSLIVETNLTGTRISYGVTGRVGPILWGDDPDANVWGRLVHPYRPGLLSKRVGDSQAIWSAAPSLPSALLREIVRRAGVHVYCDSGDQAFRSERLLAIHACSNGERTVRLPEPTDVHDAITGDLVARHATEFTIMTQRGDTPIWELA